MPDPIKSAALETFFEKKGTLNVDENLAWEIWKKAFEAASITLPWRRISDAQIEEFTDTIMKWGWAAWEKEKNREALRCLLKELINKT